MTTPDEIERYIANFAGGLPRADDPAGLFALAWLDQPVRVHFDPSAIDRGEVIGAVRNLRALPASTRGEVEPALHAFYCQQMADGAGNFDTPQAQLDWEADFASVPRFANPRHATRPGEVWALVHFFRAEVFRWHGRVIASLWAEAAWDGEHGVALHFENGARFLSVTDLNGRP